MSLEENLLPLIDDLSSDITQIKIDNAEVTVQVKRVSTEVEEIREDRRRSGDKYQDLIQRVKGLEIRVEESNKAVASMAERFERTFSMVEDRLNEAVKGVEKRLEKTLTTLKQDLDKKLDEVFNDKKFWIQSVITCVLSIVASILVARLIK